MDYKVDFEDVKFTLFDFLGVGSLTELPPFADQSADLYQSILEEGVKFAKKEIGTLNESGDRTGAKVVNGQVVMPEGFKAAFKKFGENGFMSTDLKPEYGGMGLPNTLGVAIFEFFMGANASFALVQMLTRGAANNIQTFGTEAQKQTYLHKMNSGEWCGTMCLTEPQAGSAVGDLTTAATVNADGSYAIQGTKIFITSGNHDMASNIIHLVLARVKGDAPGTKGISLFIVPNRRINGDGSLGQDNDVKLTSIEHKMGIKASPTCVLQFGDKDACQGFLIGKQAEGMKHMFTLMNEARLECGQQGVAIGATAYEHALQYAKDRTQGGKTPIINFPDVRRMLMTMKAYVESLRTLIIEAAMLADIGKHHTDAQKREEAEAILSLLTPVCKAFTSDMGFRVTELAIQVYGGYGFTQDYPAEQYMRDVKIASLYEGTNGIQAMDLIGRKFLMNQGHTMGHYLETVLASLNKAAIVDDIKPMADVVKAALSRFQEGAKTVASRAASDKSASGYLATPFLRAFGDLVCASLMVRRAAKARELLQANPTEERTRFLKGKIEAARFYVEQILPEMDLNLARIKSSDVSALADVF